MVNVWFVQPYTIAIHDSINHLQMITGEPDYAFDESLRYVGRIAKNDNVAVFGLLIGQHILTRWPRGRVRELVHQQMIPNEQSVFHRTGGNNKGLHQGGSPKQQKQNGNGPFSNAVARLLPFCMGTSILLVCVNGSCFLHALAHSLYPSPEVAWSNTVEGIAARPRDKREEIARLEDERCSEARRGRKERLEARYEPDSIGIAYDHRLRMPNAELRKERCQRPNVDERHSEQAVRGWNH